MPALDSRLESARALPNVELLPVVLAVSPMPVLGVVFSSAARTSQAAGAHRWSSSYPAIWLIRSGILGHGLANGLDAVINAASILQSQGRSDIHICLLVMDAGVY